MQKYSTCLQVPRLFCWCSEINMTKKFQIEIKLKMLIERQNNTD